MKYLKKHSFLCHNNQENENYFKVSSYPTQNGKVQQNKEQMLEECRGKGKFIHCWWHWKLMQPVWKSVWRVFNKLKINLPHGPAGALLKGLDKSFILCDTTQKEKKNMACALMCEAPSSKSSDVATISAVITTVPRITVEPLKVKQYHCQNKG